MKNFLCPSRGTFLPGFFLVCILVSSGFIACRKSNYRLRESAPPAFFSSDVLDKWLTLQVRLYKNAKGIGNGALARTFAIQVSRLSNPSARTIIHCSQI